MKQKLEKSTLAFIADLQQNNNRDWFAINKTRYEEARQDFVLFLSALLQGVVTFEPMAAGQQAKDLVFRFYRDVRFSVNKNPYKDHFGAFLAEGGKKTINPGYYLHITANNQSFIAAGLWLPPAAPLKAVRQEIDYNLVEYERIIKAPEFRQYFGEISGEKLKTNPKGYSSDNPAIPHLRHKSWVAIHKLPDAVITSAALYEECLTAIKLAKPLKDFFMHPMQELSSSDED